MSAVYATSVDRGCWRVVSEENICTLDSAMRIFVTFFSARVKEDEKGWSHSQETCREDTISEVLE
jgi:hypothetical protein